MECKDCFQYLAWNLFNVLIETLWNVKDYRIIAIKPYRQRINRNIMECKGTTTPAE